MARAIWWAREEGNKQVQARSGTPILIDSEELRTPSPNKLHFRRPWRDTVSFHSKIAVFFTAIDNPDATSLASSYRSEGYSPAGDTFERKRHGVSLRSANILQLACSLRPCSSPRNSSETGSDSWFLATTSY
jgi:hypothetical protein